MNYQTFIQHRPQTVKLLIQCLRKTAHKPTRALAPLPAKIWATKALGLNRECQMVKIKECNKARVQTNNKVNLACNKVNQGSAGS